MKIATSHTGHLHEVKAKWGTTKRNRKGEAASTYPAKATKAEDETKLLMELFPDSLTAAEADRQHSSSDTDGSNAADDDTATTHTRAACI
jgi:hypothetical protein